MSKNIEENTKALVKRTKDENKCKYTEVNVQK